MSLAEAWANIEQHIRASAESAAARVEQDLPVLAGFVSEAASNPVTVALAGAVHLPEAPEVLQVIADMITKADAALAAAKAAGAAQPQAEVPADPAAPSA